MSDGREYVIETYFGALDDTALRQTRPNGEVNISAIEGAEVWTTESSDTGSEMLRTVVLGHQFHALLFEFESTMRNVRDTHVLFAGENQRARVGDWPLGNGVATLVLDPAGERPVGLVFAFNGMPEIKVAFSDWRQESGRAAPHRLTIDDGSRTFDYTFTQVTTGADRPDWARRH